MDVMAWLAGLNPVIMVWLYRIDRRMTRMETRLDCIAGAGCDDENKKKGDK